MNEIIIEGLRFNEPIQPGSDTRCVIKASKITAQELTNIMADLSQEQKKNRLLN